MLAVNTLVEYSCNRVIELSRQGQHQDFVNLHNPLLKLIYNDPRLVKDTLADLPYSPTAKPRPKLVPALLPSKISKT